MTGPRIPRGFAPVTPRVPTGFSFVDDAAEERTSEPNDFTLGNEAFRPRPAEIERARRIVAAAETAEAGGVGAYLVDGQMVDAPFVASARALLALADRIADPAATGAR